MDLQAGITIGLGITALTLTTAATHCITCSFRETKYGTFRRPLLWAGASAPLSHAAMYAGILALVKGTGLG